MNLRVTVILCTSLTFGATTKLNVLSQFVPSGEKSTYSVPTWSVRQATVTDENATASSAVPVNVAAALSGVVVLLFKDTTPLLLT
jgi:hypothetical protein